jgi:hypothetical protein
VNATCFFFENDGNGRELLRFLWFSFSDRTAGFQVDLGLATPLVRFRFLLWFGFDLGVDLVLIGFEWPDSRVEKNQSFWENLLPLESWVCGWWVSIGSRSPVRVGQGERGSGTIMDGLGMAAMGLGVAVMGLGLGGLRR